MILQFTPDGLQIQTFEEIYNELVEGYRAIYGADINLDPDTADGQRIGIAAKAQLDLQTALLQLYNGLSPSLAQGQDLNRNIQYAGLVRRAATRSTWDITVTANATTELYSGYTIKDDGGSEWVKETAVTIPAGDTVVTFTAKELGAVEGLAGSQFEQVTVIPSVTAFDAPASATVGIEEETDQELRQRREDSTELPAFSTIGSISAKLNNITGVTDAYVHENDTPDYDPALDLNAHSIWAVVEGGEVSAIAELLAKEKTGGAGTKGDTEFTYMETLTRPDGTEYTVPHVMRFDRPDIVPVYITVNATRTGAEPVDTALIAEKLSQCGCRIFEPLEAYRLYAGALSETGAYFLSDLQISDDNVTFTDGRLDALAGGKYEIDPANVVVTEIVP